MGPEVPSTQPMSMTGTQCSFITNHWVNEFSPVEAKEEGKRLGELYVKSSQLTQFKFLITALVCSGLKERAWLNLIYAI